MKNEFLIKIEEIAKPNKYTKWYIQLISAALTRSPPAEYEVHHIFPKSFDGKFDKISNNLVKLTVREHFFAHLLLSKMFEGGFQYKMKHAISFFAASNIKESEQKWAKRSLIGLQKNEIHKQNIAKSLTGRQFSDEHKKNLSIAAKSRDYSYLKGEGNPMFGKVGNPHPRFGKSSGMQGKKHSEETKQKMSENNAMRKDPYLASRTRWSSENYEASCKKLSENNPNMKQWKITNLETGEEVIISNLKKFCEENSLTYNYLVSLAKRGKSTKTHKVEQLNKS